MNKMNKLILLLILVNLTFAQSQSPNFDFSGMDQFWKIVNILESNWEPSKNDWEQLFNTPGYKILVNSEFNKQFFIDNFTLVFKPAKRKELDEKLKNGKYNHHINHYIKVRDNKSLIKEQQKLLQRNNFNKIAIDRTIEFLSQNNVSQYPPVSFLIFESNGRGSSPIIVDVAASIEWDFVGFLAHEFHHWYRNNQLQFNYSNIEKDEFNIVKVLSMIEAEGIADMVDKKDWFTKPNSAISAYARQFINDVGKTPYLIKQIDKLLIEMGTDQSKAKYIGEQILNSLPQRGHTTGYFMASLIIEKLGKKELISSVGNPFEFVTLYNKAAKRSSGKYPKFSDDAIKVIKQLEVKYN